MAWRHERLIVHCAGSASNSTLRLSCVQAVFRVRAMDAFLNLARLPEADADAAGPCGFQVSTSLVMRRSQSNDGHAGPVPCHVEADGSILPAMR